MANEIELLNKPMYMYMEKDTYPTYSHDKDLNQLEIKVFRNESSRKDFLAEDFNQEWKFVDKINMEVTR
ncbi:hypothetical protein [Metabacillus sp. Hm71]|uniref:hypothetical protein n=1 Tax=Metabacillus sp. Hm71 TaxID=3450743 RepID=UPI003F432F4F